MGQTKVVSYSELDTYRQCPFKHELAYRQRWTPDTEAPALSRGRLFHEVMELHYRRLDQGLKLPAIAQELQTNGMLYDTTTGASTEEQDLVAWVYDGHVEKYGADPDWEIVGVELKIEDWLPTRRGTRSHFKLKGRVDLLVRDRTMDGLWVVDHKTCRNLPKGKDLDFDDQAAVYSYLLRRRGLDIQGVIFNHCRTYKLQRPMSLDERFRRTITTRTQQELENMALEVLETFRAAYRPREGEPPRAPDPDRCGWRCPYTEPCLGARKGLDLAGLLGDHGFRQDFERH